MSSKVENLISIVILLLAVSPIGVSIFSVAALALIVVGLIRLTRLRRRQDSQIADHISTELVKLLFSAHVLLSGIFSYAIIISVSMVNEEYAYSFVFFSGNAMLCLMFLICAKKLKKDYQRVWDIWKNSLVHIDQNSAVVALIVTEISASLYLIYYWKNIQINYPISKFDLFNEIYLLSLIFVLLIQGLAFIFFGLLGVPVITTNGKREN